MCLEVPPLLACQHKAKPRKEKFFLALKVNPPVLIFLSRNQAMATCTLQHNWADCRGFTDLMVQHWIFNVVASCAGEKECTHSKRAGTLSLALLLSPALNLFLSWDILPSCVVMENQVLYIAELQGSSEVSTARKQKSHFPLWNHPGTSLTGCLAIPYLVCLLIQPWIQYLGNAVFFWPFISCLRSWIA